MGRAVRTHTGLAAALITASMLAGTASPVHGQDTADRSRRASTLGSEPEVRVPAADPRTFVADLALTGLSEIRLGELAMRQGERREVREFGRSMVEDHTRANGELQLVASRLGVEMPSRLDQAHEEMARKLAEKRGSDFDRAYIDAMIEGHRAVADKLRSRASTGRALPATGGAAGTSTTESGVATGQVPRATGTTGAVPSAADVDQWASKTLPVVERHLLRAQEIERTLGDATTGDTQPR